jgi:soluble lytic murein transglycosylase-like protein
MIGTELVILKLEQKLIHQKGEQMKLFSILAAILITLYVPLAVDPAINPKTGLMELTFKALDLDQVIESSYQNETVYIKAAELDFKIEQQRRIEYTDQELKEMSYDTLLIIDNVFVMRKLKLSGKKGRKKELEKLAKAIARKHKIPPNLFVALIKTESNFDEKAKSDKQATGLCQILPENFERLDIKDPHNPIQNMEGGAKFLKEMLDKFDGKLTHALAAYNAGPGAVLLHNGIPPYQETQEYVQKVFENFRIYKKG